MITVVSKAKLRTPIAFIDETKQFTVYGRSFYDIRAVYLSGIPYNGLTTFYNPFSSVPSLSAAFPGFTGIKLLSATYFTDNVETLTFTIPAPPAPGFIDVIVENQAGYGSLTRYVRPGPYNPYPVGSTDYNNYQPYVRPWAQGISVELQPTDLNIVTIENDDILLVTISDEEIVQIS